jgi:FHA domain
VYHALVVPGVERNLKPPALVNMASTTSADEFARTLDMPLLLVRLDDPAGEMAQVLEGRGDDAGSRVEAGMGFHTVSTERPTHRPITIPPPPSFAPGQLLVRVIRACHFIVPIGKRANAGRVFSERVTVGRARNSDIVLRHESVSKFHAWFARDDENAYFVTDASSRNGTTRNGTQLEGGAHVRLRVGDLLRFGSVEATFCDALTLHAAVHTK